MLHFINGGSGTGKTTIVINKIAEYISNSQKNVYFIVPEQQSFESKKILLNTLGEQSVNKVEIITFSRFPDFLMRICGGFCGEKIDDGGKRILMSCAIDEVKDKLKIYSEQSNNIDFIEMMLAIIKEYKSECISVDMLYKVSNKFEKSVLKNKLLDCALIYQVYSAMLDEKYIDTDDDLDRVTEILKSNNIFSNSVIFVDGFSGFTLQQFGVIECIIKQCDDFFITLPSRDIIIKKGSIFTQIENTKKSLIKIAENNNIIIDTPIECLKDYRHNKYNCEDIEYFADNIYSGNTDDLLPPPRNIKNIEIYNSSDKYEEITYIANQIKKLVFNNYSYKDIVVVTRDIDTYSNIISSVFSKCDIPLFMDIPHMVDGKPLIKLIMSAFNIVKYGFDTSYIFAILKTELTNIDLYDISLLENYAYMWSLKPNEWKKEFTKNPNGFGCEENKELLDRLNELREIIITPIINFTKNIKCDNGAEMAKAVYTLLEELKVDEQIQEYSDYLKNQNVSEDLINEQERLWNVLVEVLDQMYMTLSDKHITVERFIDLFKIVVKCHDISYIPQRLDQVTIGTANRIRFHNPKIVFIIGAEEGVFPSIPTENGMFTDAERKTLMENDLPLINDIESLSLQEKYYTYMAVSAPSEKLFISYCNFDLSGGRIYKSSIVRELCNLLPDIETKTSSSLGIEEKLWNKALAFDMCADLFNMNDGLSSTLKNYFKGQFEYQSKIEAIQRQNVGDRFKFINPNNTHYIFSKNMSLSPSQIETYHTCSCKYLISYGFHIYARKKASIDFKEYGSLMHYILENIIKNNTQNGDNSFSNLYVKDSQNNEILDEKKLRTIIGEYLQSYINEMLGGMEDKSQRVQYMLNRLINTAFTVVSYVIKSLKDNKFKPIFFELAIDHSHKYNTIEPYEIKTENGNIYVTGKIDRVDILEDDKKYLRVIDYKTGKKLFSLNDVVNGLNMQMLIYLDTLYKTKNNLIGDIVPSGIIYSPASSRTVSKDNIIKEKSEVEKAQNTNMKMNGLVIDENIIIDSVKDCMNGVKKDKNGKSKSIITIDEMKMLFDKVEDNIKKMYFNIQKGNIKVNPTSHKSYLSCDYCDYRSICCFENNMKINDIIESDKDEVLKNLKEEFLEKEKISNAGTN